jgi:cell division protein FtsW (lipid II flippase)
VSRGTLIAGGLIALVGVGWLVTHETYRMDRIRHHMDRWAEENMDDIGWQTVQSEIGQAAGGVVGVGPGAGRAKHVLPAATTDFINATIGEEFGLIGMLGVLGVLGALAMRLFMAARQASSRFGGLVLIGLGSWIGIQTCVNVMMSNGLLPAIGIPMPFVSSGGSSLIALWLGIGIANSVLAPARVKEGAVEANRDGWGHRRTRLSRA